MWARPHRFNGRLQFADPDERLSHGFATLLVQPQRGRRHAKNAPALPDLPLINQFESTTNHAAWLVILERHFYVNDIFSPEIQYLMTLQKLPADLIDTDTGSHPRPQCVRRLNRHGPQPLRHEDPVDANPTERAAVTTTTPPPTLHSAHAHELSLDDGSAIMRAYLDLPNRLFPKCV